jgi:hypothetical protein
MGIIDELSEMKTRTQQRQIEEQERERQETIVRENERKEREKEERLEKIREKQQKILEILNSDDPELDIPYPYMEKYTSELRTGRKWQEYEREATGGYYPLRVRDKVLVDEGKVAGCANKIRIGTRAITKREVLLMQLLGEKIKITIEEEMIENKTGEYRENIGSLQKDAAIFERDNHILDREETESYLETLPEEIKEKLNEEIELKNKKIELINNTKTKEMSRKGFLSVYGSNVAVKTTFGRALLGLGETNVKRYFTEENRFKNDLKCMDSESRGDILATNDIDLEDNRNNIQTGKNTRKITFDSIKKAIKNRLKGER